ncbi:MAG TPA: hypothetical protein VH479_15690 [Acidimicrobiales bacterium]|jgi:hypothetical protein
MAATCVPVLIAALGCGASRPTTEDAAEAETADRVCDMLRGWYNDLSTSVNATMETITDQDDPTTANGILLNGWDDLLTLSQAHEQQAAELTLPYSADRARLLADLQDGAAAATDRLESERTDIENAAPITVDQQGGTLAGAELAIEGARALFEPPVEDYGNAALLQAFADNDGCDHVVQTN